VNLISDNVSAILPIMFASLYKNSKTHWNRTIHGLVYNALRVLMEMDPVLFDECATKFKQSRHMERKKQKDREENWRKLEEAAANNLSSNPELQAKNVHLINAKAYPIMRSALDDLDTDEDEETFETNHDTDPERRSNSPASLNLSDEDEILDEFTKELDVEFEDPAAAAYSRFRRKSTLPVDEQVVMELQRHKSLTDVLTMSDTEKTEGMMGDVEVEMDGRVAAVEDGSGGGGEDEPAMDVE